MACCPLNQHEGFKDTIESYSVMLCNWNVGLEESIKQRLRTQELMRCTDPDGGLVLLVPTADKWTDNCVKRSAISWANNTVERMGMSSSCMKQLTVLLSV